MTIKYLHKSRLIKYFTENTNQKKYKKILIKFTKKLKKIENIFFQQKI